jgi:hypothetical protein
MDVIKGLYFFDSSSKRHYLSVDNHSKGSGLYRCKEDGRYYVLTDDDMRGMQSCFLPPEQVINDWAMYEHDKATLMIRDQRKQENDR